MNALSNEAFRATFKAPMQRVPVAALPSLDFFCYFDAIPSADFDDHICPGNVTYVWEDATTRYQHILFNSEDKAVFMVVVLDLKAMKVLGHHLLDLRALYSITADTTTTDEEFLCPS